MGFFDKFKKRPDVIDLTSSNSQIPQPKSTESDTYSYPLPSQESSNSNSNNQTETSNDPLGMLSSLASSSSPESATGYINIGSSTNSSSAESDNTGSKLSKRFMDMTTKIEDMSNEIYRLQQRIEMLEQKLRTSSGY